MSPEDRRAALVEATLPLLREFGASVSTRQIADAAGVAEGTIFRAFTDKNSLLAATVIRGTDMESRASLIDGVDMKADLRTRLTQVVELLVKGMRAFGRLPEVMQGLMGNPETRDLVLARMNENRTRTVEALIELIEPDRDRLRVSVSQAARIILVMIFSSRGIVDESEQLTGAEIVAVLLDGLLVPTSVIEPTPQAEVA
jgi:AcrR family transcriptional regulator